MLRKAATCAFDTEGKVCVWGLGFTPSDTYLLKDMHEDAIGNPKCQALSGSGIAQAANPKWLNGRRFKFSGFKASEFPAV